MPHAGVQVGGADQRQLETWLGSDSTPQGLATRPRTVLCGAAGESRRSLADRLGVIFRWTKSAQHRLCCTCLRDETLDRAVSPE
jgi:hypothetical protein